MSRDGGGTDPARYPLHFILCSSLALNSHVAAGGMGVGVRPLQITDDRERRDTNGLRLWFRGNGESVYVAQTSCDACIRSRLDTAGSSSIRGRVMVAYTNWYQLNQIAVLLLGKRRQLTIWKDRMTELSTKDPLHITEKLSDLGVITQGGRAAP